MKYIYKKCLAFFLMATVVGAMSGCGSQKTVHSISDSTQPSSKPSAPSSLGTSNSVTSTDSKPTITNAPTKDPAPEDPIQNLIASMSLEEKVGQLFFVRCPETGAMDDIKTYHLGGYLLFARDFENQTKDSMKQILTNYQNASAIPLLLGVDEEGGTVTRISRFSAFRKNRFSSPSKVYSTGGFSAIIKDTKEKCSLLKELGINVNFAPVCDVSTDPNDFIYQRAFGQDASKTSLYVTKVVEEMKQQQVGSVLKHFPGYGTNVDTHTGISIDQRSYDTFTSSDFLPFSAGIQSGTDCVLVSHNIVNCMDDSKPASLSAKVHRILRKDLGFTGVVITDDLAMDAVKKYTGGASAAVCAVQAGNDMLCSTDYKTQIPAVIKAVKEGNISEEKINQSVARVLHWKQTIGLLS